MRILVTNFGDTFIKSFAEENKAEMKNQEEKKTIDKDTRSNTPGLGMFRKTGNNFNKSHSNFGKTFYSGGTSSTSAANLIQNKSREIEIKMNKVNLNRKNIEKYNRQDDIESFLLPELPESLTRKLDMLNSERSAVTPPHKNGSEKELVELVPIQDVIKEETLKKLLNNVKEKRNVEIKIM